MKTVPVLISEDAYAEGPEELIVTLTSVTGGSLGAVNPTRVRIEDDDAADGASNPIDDDATFVCQHYHDFFSRKADDAGQAFRTNQLAARGGDAGCLDRKREAALRSVVESGSVYNELYNPAFVLMQYFAYLRRNPDAAPDNNFDGYNFWLAKLNQFTLPGEDARDEGVARGRVRRAEMVRAFLLSAEYRGRFQGDPNRGS